MFEIRIDIPALDRLCDILESSAVTVQEYPQEAAQAAETAQEPVSEAVQEPAKEEPEQIPEEPAKEEPEPVKAIRIEDVMTAARKLCADAQNRVKLTGEVFNSFGIEKISDLKTEQLAAFAAVLREMGGEL